MPNPHTKRPVTSPNAITGIKAIAWDPGCHNFKAYVKPYPDQPEKCLRSSNAEDLWIIKSMIAQLQGHFCGGFTPSRFTLDNSAPNNPARLVVRLRNGLRRRAKLYGKVLDETITPNDKDYSNEGI